MREATTHPPSQEFLRSSTPEIDSLDRRARARLQPSYNEKYKQIFSEFTELVSAGPNPSASLVAMNPRLVGEDFGSFVIPSLHKLCRLSPDDLSSLNLSEWALSTQHKKDALSYLVPPETGRALLLAPSKHKVYRDILVKGTGHVERFTLINKLRDRARGFDGNLELSEAERDLVHADILCLAGIRATIGIGIVNHQKVSTYPDFTAWVGNYVRGFRYQIRISNCFELSPGVKRRAIEEAVKRLYDLGEVPSPTNLVHYFLYILQVTAQTAARMQAIGFTQDSLHYGQLTLAGELVDLGIGHFRRPKTAGEINTLHPWFRFERQPILFLNMLYKTHAVKSEPAPVRLEKHSRAVQEQRTLFALIRDICRDSANQIESMDPESIFWQEYERNYKIFNSVAFKDEVIDRIDSHYFKLDLAPLLAGFPRSVQARVLKRFQNKLELLNEHFERQVATWDRRGPTRIHQGVLLNQCLREEHILPSTSLAPFLAQEIITEWPKNYRNYAQTGANRETDLSWKPDFKSY